MDDILIMSPNDSDILWLIDMFEKEFGKVDKDMSNKFTYLGMGLQINDDQTIELSMEKYIGDEVLKSDPSYANIKKYSTPADSKLFDTSKGRLLYKGEKQRFHTCVAKLLYLCCKRTRPNI